MPRARNSAWCKEVSLACDRARNSIYSYSALAFRTDVVRAFQELNMSTFYLYKPELMGFIKSSNFF